MKAEDTDKVVDILASEAYGSNEGSEEYFRALVKESHISKNFKYQTEELLDRNPATAARNLVDWAKEKNTNPDNPDSSILGDLLCPLLPKLGEEDCKTILKLMFCYHLVPSKQLLEISGIENNFDKELILVFAHACLGKFQEISAEDLFEPFIQILVGFKNLDFCIEAFLKLFENPFLKAEEQEQFIARIKNQSIKIECRIFILVKLLLEDEILPESPISRIADFAAHLKLLVGASSKKKLTEWLKLIESIFSYKSVIKASPSKKEKTTPNAYLMIVIRKAPARGKKFHVNAFLLAEHQETKISEWLILEDENPGPYTLKSLKGRVSSFVLMAEEKLIGIARFNIVVEIFLPLQYWCEEVDCWPVEILSEDIPIGRNYRITLRAYERITDVVGTNDFKESAALRHKLMETWEDLAGFLQATPDKSEIGDRIARIGRENNCCPSVLEKQLIESEFRKYGLSITCVPPIHQAAKRQREAIFKAALLNGFLIVIWARCEDTTDGKLEQTIASCLDKDCLMDFNRLLTRLKEKREKSHISKRGYGRHIAILCDDPNRLPTEPLPLVG
jgi:hypothetical protein